MEREREGEEEEEEEEKNHFYSWSINITSLLHSNSEFGRIKQFIRFDSIVKSRFQKNKNDWRTCEFPNNIVIQFKSLKSAIENALPILKKKKKNQIRATDSLAWFEIEMKADVLMYNRGEREETHAVRSSFSYSLNRNQ